MHTLNRVTTHALWNYQTFARDFAHNVAIIHTMHTNSKLQY